MRNKIFAFLTRLIVVALIFAPALPAFAVPDYVASIPCPGPKPKSNPTLTPNESIVRVKGVANTLEFELQPQADVNLSISNWKINNELIFDNNGPTQAGANWGVFTRENGMKTIRWTLGGTKEGEFKLTAVLKRSCGGGLGGAGDQPDEDLDLWSGSVIKIEIKRDIAGGTEQFDPITDANRNVLPGQKMILRADVQGLPEGATPSYVWKTLPGKVFEDWTADQDRATLTEIYSDDLDQQNINFYWADTGDGRKVQVSVTVNAKTADAEATFNTNLPTSILRVTQLGASRINTAGDTLGLYGVPAINPDGDPNPGIEWVGAVSTPTDFTGGRFNFVQLAKSNYRKVGTDGEVHHGYLDGILRLDTTYPYEPRPYTSHPGTAGSYLASGVGHSESDSPSMPLGADEQTYNVRLDFKTYLMFLPPGEDSRYVPLRMFTWAYGAIVNKGAAGWVRQEGSAIQESNPPKEALAPSESKHPTWFVRSNPDIFTWNKGTVAVNIIPTTVNEGAGIVSGQANVTVLENVAAPLVVNLSAADVTAAIVPFEGEKIVVPATVTIPANSKSVQFSFTVTNNDTKDPTQIMRVTASATGYTPTEDTVAVLDND